MIIWKKFSKTENRSRFHVTMKSSRNRLWSQLRSMRIVKCIIKTLRKKKITYNKSEIENWKLSGDPFILDFSIFNFLFSIIMLQRIQTVYLLIIAALTIAILFLPLAVLQSGDQLFTFDATGISTMAVQPELIYPTWGLFALAIVNKSIRKSTCIKGSPPVTVMPPSL